MCATPCVTGEGWDVCATPCVTGKGACAQRLVSWGSVCATPCVTGKGACAQRLVSRGRLVHNALCHGRGAVCTTPCVTGGRARSGLRDWGRDVCATPCVMGVGPRAQRLVSRGGACAQRLVSPGACAQRLVYVYYIIEFRLRLCHTLTVLINFSAFVELYNTVLNFRHFFLRLPVSFTAMSPFQAGSCDRMKSSEECAMINQILLSCLFAGLFPLSKEEQS